MIKRVFSYLILFACFITGIRAQRTIPPTISSNHIKEPDWVSAKHTQVEPEEKFHTKWSSEPFNRQYFVENKGQFDTDVVSDKKILFQAILGDVKAYFTTGGVIYRYDILPELEKGKDPDEDAVSTKPVYRYASYTWSGANVNVEVDGGEKQAFTYGYQTGPSSSIKVNAFKKIVYHNIYPGIDIEYSFPEKKKGIKYAVIVHPGADLSKVKSVYNGLNKIHLNSNGDAVVKTDIGDITDHEPITYYKSTGQRLSSSYKIVNGNEETFKVEIAPNVADDIIIDPWSTSPGFAAAYNMAYDVDYDNAGNVYAYGSYNPFQLTKFNSAGVIQWTFPATAISAGGAYGDFAVDKATGTCYIGQGGAGGAAVKIIKLYTNNTVAATFAGTAMLQEIWRMIYSPCTGEIVMGCGGPGVPNNTANTQACMMDTTLTTFTPVNSLGAVDGYHDVCIMALDPTGANAYMAFALPTANTNFSNKLISIPVPALSPAAYKVTDAFGFAEGGSVGYLAAGVTNGMNGMAASANWLYLYDGDTLKKVNKGTGAIVANKAVANQPFSWGGVDVDQCDNVYVGENSKVQIYDVNLTLVTTLPAYSGTVFDVVLSTNQQTLYVCGDGFVASTDVSKATTSVKITNSITPASCGACNGSATPTLLICGNAPTAPTYSWNTTPVQTTQTATGLCKGSYTVTITTGTCPPQIYTDTLTVTQTTPGSLSLIKNQTNIKCNGGANGVASVTASGGTGAGTYTYLWAPSGGTSSASTPLGPGTYTVTATDAACNSDTAIFTITQPPLLRDSITTVVPVKCFGDKTGALTVGVKGGAGAYSYSWNSTPIQTNATASNLSAGSYTVTVTDANGCPATANSTIVQPTPIRDSIVSSVPPTCGKSNGSITIGAKNGTPGYSYLWNSTPQQTNATATALPSGTYTCIVTDNNGCKDSASFTLVNPSGPRDSIVSTSSISCNGGANGSIVLGVNRGTTPYSFLWNNSTSATTQNIGGLKAGAYSVLVTDANGCTTTASATIVQPSLIRDSLVDTINVSCFGGNNGSATVGVKGGTPGAGYSFSWNTTPVQTTATATGLSAGGYICTIKDANGCVSILNVTINQPKKLTLVAAAFPVTCFGACNGSVAVIPKGGTTPYAYLWNTPSNSTNPSPSGLCAGTYSVQVTDNNGCIADSTGLVVTQPSAISITKNVITSSHCGQTDGSATINVTGGTPGYKYLWSNNSTNQNLSNAVPGLYCVTVTDANSCTDTACVTINNVPSPVVIITGLTNVTCNGGNNGSATATATGGASPYKYSWSTTPTADTTSVVNNLTAGQYTVTVTDSGGCISTAIATITQPAVVVTSINLPPTICIGDSTTLNATSVGGTPPYTYTWNTGSTSSSIRVGPDTTTTYTVTTTLDSNKCPGAAVTVTVVVNPPLKLNVTAKPDTICLGNSATLNAGASGGDGTYSYSWTPGSLTGSPVTVTPTVNTVYTVIVKDGCGTPADTDSVSIVIEPSPVVKFTVGPTAGCYPHCITCIDKSTVPGGAISSVEWTFGNGATSNADTGRYCYDTSGIFSVGLIVTTNIGCTDSLVKPNIINVYSHPVASFTASPSSTTTADANICFTNTSTDAYGIKSNLWMFNEPPKDSTDTARNTCYQYHDSGTYCPMLYVTNIHGCKDSTKECIEISPYFTLYIPNAFSPNGDGLNDVFAPKGQYVCSFEMYIFDRWGMLLYFTQDMNQGWDGTVNGGTNQVQEDTYVYLIVVYDCPTHKKHSYIGKVSVVK